MTIHRHQQVTFSTRLPSISGAFLDSLVRSTYSFEVGAIYTLLANELMTSTRVRTNSVDFTLINVYSPFFKISYGRVLPPQQDVHPRNALLMFTFATTSDYDIKQTNDIRRTSNNVVQYDGNKYITIGLNAQTCHECGIFHLNLNGLRYLYNLIGIMTKLLIMKQQFYDSFEDSLTQPFNILCSKYFNLPIPSLTRHPYPFWGLNRNIWQKCPNVLSFDAISPTVALFYFTRIIDLVPYNKISDLECGMAIRKLLEESLMSFLQQVNTAVSVQLSRKDFLFPAVLGSIIYKNSVQTDVVNERALRYNVYDIATLFSGRVEELLPIENTVNRILNNDTDFFSRLVGDL